MLGANCSAHTRRCEVRVAADPMIDPAAGTLVTFSPRLSATDRPIPTYVGIIRIAPCAMRYCYV